MTDVRDGRRVDVPTEMFDAITKYDNAQLVAVAAYQASLKTPGLLLCRNPTDKAKMTCVCRFRGDVRGVCPAASA